MLQMGCQQSVGASPPASSLGIGQACTLSGDWVVLHHLCQSGAHVVPCLCVSLPSKVKFVQGACDGRASVTCLPPAVRVSGEAGSQASCWRRQWLIRWRILPTQVGWSEELNVNKNDSCPPLGCPIEVQFNLGKLNTALLPIPPTVKAREMSWQKDCLP